MSRITCAASAFAALLAAGCGNYTVKFEVQKIINAPGDDHSRQLLDIDVVCLARAEADANPKLADGSVRSDEWFRSRARGEAPASKLSQSRVYALRAEGGAYASYTSDTVKGTPLASPADGGKTETAISINLAEFLESGATILVYGRFHDGKGGLLATAPVRIAPPPRWNTTLVIDVDRQALAWKNPPE